MKRRTSLIFVGIIALLGIGLMRYFTQKGLDEAIQVVLIDTGLSQQMIDKLPENIQVMSYSPKENSNPHADMVLSRIH